MKVSEAIEILTKTADPNAEVWLELMESEACPTCGSEDERKYYGPAESSYPVRHGKQPIFVIHGRTE